MSDKLVWLPMDPDDLGDLPGGLRYERLVPDPDALPDSVGDVAFYVPAYDLGPKGSSSALFSAMTSLEVVQTLTAGVDNVRANIPDGVTLCNARGVHDASTSELAVTLTLASLRGVPSFVRDQDQQTWRHRQQPALADKRVLILGYGSIGEAIERRLLPFEVEVVRVARTERDGVHSFEDLPQLLPDVDVVILVVPLTDETRAMVDAEFLARLKDGALVVNVARGPVIDTDALLAELTSERIWAALDVTDPEPLPRDHPLWLAPRLLVSPHVGGATSAMWPRALRLVREQLERFAAGEPLVNRMSGSY